MRELSPRKRPPAEEERCASRPPPEGAGAAAGAEPRPLERAAAGGWCRSCQAQLAELRRQAARLAAGGCPPNAPPVSAAPAPPGGRGGGGCGSLAPTRKGSPVPPQRIWEGGVTTKPEISNPGGFFKSSRISVPDFYHKAKLCGWMLTRCYSHRLPERVKNKIGTLGKS